MVAAEFMGLTADQWSGTGLIVGTYCVVLFAWWFGVRSRDYLMAFLAGLVTSVSVLIGGLYLAFTYVANAAYLPTDGQAGAATLTGVFAVVMAYLLGRRALFDGHLI